MNGSNLTESCCSLVSMGIDSGLCAISNPFKASDAPEKVIEHAKILSFLALPGQILLGGNLVKHLNTDDMKDLIYTRLILPRSNCISEGNHIFEAIPYSLQKKSLSPENDDRVHSYYLKIEKDFSHPNLASPSDEKNQAWKTKLFAGLASLGKI